ncbi:hypothetical protein M501DRAFT_997168 [Patellaria atrata CBS 101060]|uniref:DUF8035 domain-containing protein n=1 Tax=Patellaria atrata CBS 101060 TaxID=1346257 RepID=A0A9P4S499_9PEZI|nr:hypothetical protein M501DRAFT_997168 [Patellaria atrata CBS 101060]
MAYRSTGNLGVYEDPAPPTRGNERWDRGRFEAFARKDQRDPRDSRDSPRFEERDRERFEERDRFGPRGRRDIEFDERIDRRGPKGNVTEKDRFFEEDRYGGPRRSRPDFLNEPTPAEIANRALAPYRRKSVVERDFDFEVPARRPTRPQYIRRQSSLDTFDRRPFPRYGDKEREEWKPPTNVPIPLPIRDLEREKGRDRDRYQSSSRRQSPSRRRSPSRPQYRDDDFEEIRYEKERDDRYRDDDYRDVNIRRERSVRRRESRPRSKSVRSSSLSSFEEITVPEKKVKKGRTRMPKRLVEKRAIIDLGFPFEEEDDFIIVRQALEKEQIDEVIKISEGYKKEETTRISYRYEEVAPPSSSAAGSSPPTQSVHDHYGPPPPQSVNDHYGPPPPLPPQGYAHPPPQTYAPPPPVAYPPPQSVRTVSPPRTVYEERVEQSGHISGPLTMVLPERRRQSRHDIDDEIRRLEDERRVLKYERDSREIQKYERDNRDVDYEFVERSKDRDVVRVDRDRKGRLALVRSSH